jgi:hypothetical protein
MEVTHECTVLGVVWIKWEGLREWLREAVLQPLLLRRCLVYLLLGIDWDLLYCLRLVDGRRSELHRRCKNG